MSEDIYAELKSAIDNELVPAFFRPATIQRSVPGSYNVNTMLTSAPTTQTISCDAVARTRKTRLENGVLHTDTVMTMTVAPQIADTILQGTFTYKVQSIETVAPTGTAIIYRAVVTR